MTNLEIKKAIQAATKKADSFEVRVIIWHGDGTYHNEGEIIYNNVEVVDNDNNTLFSNGFGTSYEREAFEQDINLLKAEQKKMYNYLRKYFENVTMSESNV